VVRLRNFVAELGDGALRRGWFEKVEISLDLIEMRRRIRASLGENDAVGRFRRKDSGSKILT
jgi:hypothetical protein